MLLPDDHRAVQDAVRAYVEAEIAPNAARWDRECHFPAEQLRGLAQLGCYGVAVPAEWDGAGLDYLALSVILEEIAAGDGATSTIVSVNNCPVCSILMAWGSEAQKEQWLRPLARGEMLGAFCLTEPHAGSQADALRTTATRDGADYVLNGVKQFITSGKNGDVAIVMAVPTRAPARRASARSSCRRRHPATVSTASRTSSASTPATPRRSASRTAACRPRTGSATKARG